MIDITKQYTYDGMPVRIYADGSDTQNDHIHFAYFHKGKWRAAALHESYLVEVWKPKVRELCYFWDDDSDHMCICKFLRMHRNMYIDETNTDWKYCAPFNGTLPKAFKGL